MVVRPVWLAIAMLACRTIVKGEAPFSASAASEAVSLLKDSSESQAIEAAALAEASLQDDDGGRPAKVDVRPHLRGPNSVMHVSHPAHEQVNASAITGAVNMRLSSSSGAMNMEKMLTEMALSGKAAFGATPFGSSVKQITDLIEKDMMPKVLAAHTANQQELDKGHKEILECSKTKNLGVGKANKKKQTYLTMSPLHKTCRAGEAGKSTERTECLNELRDKRGLMNLKCKEFAFNAKKYGDQNANRQIAKKQGSESDESYIRRMTSTICGTYPPGGRGGGGKNGFLDHFIIAKDACAKAAREFKEQTRKCSIITKEYHGKKKECDNLQDLMDTAACNRAVMMKDACETYAECYYDKKKVQQSTEAMFRIEEKDRQAEWRGLKRMQCLMVAMGTGKVTAKAVQTCKARTIDVDHLVLKYPSAGAAHWLPRLEVCTVPDRYPSTAQYKLAEFSMLPALAKGKSDANECTGVLEIPNKPAKGSPKTCKCERVTLNGPYSAGPLVKCSNCWTVRRSQDKSSCPWGTKLFSPRGAEDWKTIFASVGELRDPSFIVDITRPQNGCGGCTDKPMNSGPKGQPQYWHTSDGSPWWLRSRTFKEPSGNYQANCYLAMLKPKDGIPDANNLKFDDHACKAHSKSYYCQLKYLSTTPKRGSPSSCKCEKVALTGIYSSGALLRCTGCLRVSKSTQKNSCPRGTKLFAPGSVRDWRTFLASATPLRSPNFIIDVTRPQNGCGGCTKFPMNSHQAPQMTWRTSDGSPWWLRSSKYTEPSGDYKANCYMDLWKPAPSENSVMFNDANCKYHSNGYYCQPVKLRRPKTATGEPR